MPLVDTLYSPFVLISGSASVSGIEFSTSEKQLQFGVVEQVCDQLQKVSEGDSVLFNIVGAKTLIIGGSEYLMIDVNNIYLKEVEPPLPL